MALDKNDLKEIEKIVEKSVGSRINKFEAHFDTKLKATEAHFDTKLKATEAHFDTKLKATEANIDKKLKATEDNFGKKLQKTEEYLEDRIEFNITQSEREMGRRFNQVDDRLESIEMRVSKVENEIIDVAETSREILLAVGVHDATIKTHSILISRLKDKVMPGK